MSDKDTKIEKILENKLNYQNNTTTTEDVVDDTVIDEVAREVKEYISKLPDKLPMVGIYTFRNCPNVKISNFGGPTSSLIAIKQGAFQNAGEGLVAINIYAPVTILGVINEPGSYVGAGAFSNYPVDGKLQYLNSYQPITAFTNLGGESIEKWSDVGITSVEVTTISELTL